MVTQLPLSRDVVVVFPNLQINLSTLGFRTVSLQMLTGGQLADDYRRLL